jgi:molybdate transport system substrate-binding protein
VKTIFAIFWATAIQLVAPSSFGAEITVSAAASLKDAFEAIGKAYETVRPGTKVVFNFGASGQLLQQLVAGAPVDVLATADLDTMDKAERQSMIAIGSKVVFARNQLVVAVPMSSSLVLRALGDLTDARVKRIALGNPDSVPAGKYARDVLVTARIWSDLQDRIVFAQNVRQALDYVARGEVDAAFVYRTDALIATNRAQIAFTVATETPVRYPAAVVNGSSNPVDAEVFVRFLLGEPAQRVLEKLGFGRP